MSAQFEGQTAITFGVFDFTTQADQTESRFVRRNQHEIAPNYLMKMRQIT